MERVSADRAIGPKTALGPGPGMMVAALAAVLGVAANARAEPWTVIPTLAVGAIYDDNIFFNAARRGGAGLRAGPALRVQYQPSARFKVLGRLAVDSEYFGDPEVNSWAARRTAGLAASYRLGEFTTASASADYYLTAYASELLPAVGVEYGRRAAESLGSKLELEHRVSPQIRLRAGYGMQSYQLETSGRGMRSQLSPDVDVAFRVGPRTTLSLQAGPRFLAGSFSGHVAGTLERTVPRGRVAVAYARGRSLAFDRTLLIESYTAKVSFILSPMLRVTASPALFRQWEQSTEQRTWHVGAEALYRTRSWLALFVAHAYVMEDRAPLTIRSEPSQLARNTVTAGFVLLPYHAPEGSKP